MENIVRYSDFGAIGDGVNNDFSAIKAAHDYANEHHLAVEGTPDKIYRLGDNGTESIIIKTDTLWSGCAFILDDSEIMPDDPCRTVDMFKVVPDKARVNIEGVTSLKKTDTNIGIALGFPALVHIVNENQRRYIRSGLNMDKGDAQREVILVDAEGNIDPSTPLCWDYTEVTKIFAVPVDEEPIIINGGNFVRLANHAPNEYTYYSRGIRVTRCNVKIMNVTHRMDGLGATRAPYSGFITIDNVNNFTIENAVFNAHVHYYKDQDGKKNLLGSYEINFTSSNNVLCKNCYQPNMYEPDGARIAFKGEMGSNYCRNMTFDGCRMSSYDSHKGSGNINILNSEIEHINCIGAGTVRIENTIVHLDNMPQIMTLRGDYGCIWMGDAYIKDVTIVGSDRASEFTLMGGYGAWENYDFGYETCMPHTITISNLRTTAGKPVYLYRTYINKYGDVSKPTLDDGTPNKNPYKPTKKVIIESNKYGTEFIINDSPLFKDTELVIK